MSQVIEPRRRRPSIGIGIGILAFVATGYVLWIGQEIIKPLVIALMLVTMMQPFVTFMNRLRVPTWASVALLIGLLLRLIVWGGETVVVQAWAFVTSQPFADHTTPSFRKDLEGLASDEDDAEDDGTEDDTVAPEEVVPPRGAEAGADGAIDDGGTPAPSQNATSAPPTAADARAPPATSTHGSGPAAGSPFGGADASAPPPAGGARATPLRGFTDMVLELQHVLERVGIPTQIVKNITTAIESWYRQEDTLALLGVGFTSVSIGFIAKFILVVAFMAFLFAEGRVFRQKVLAIAGKDADEAGRVLTDIAKRVQRYLLVKTAASLLTGMICYWVLVALGVPYALTFGFLTFLLNYIPTFGSFIAAVPPFLFSFVGAQSLLIPSLVVIVYLTVNVVIGVLLEPRVLGDELNLSPIVILMSVAFWATLWGATGAFLAVPMTAAAQISMAHIETLRPIAILLSNRVPDEGGT